MRTSGGKRFDSSGARERCDSNGPQGEPRRGELSSITDQIQNPAQRAGLFAFEAWEDENLRGQEVRLERSERTLRQQRPAGRATTWRVILYHRPNSKPCSTSRVFCFCRPDKRSAIRHSVRTAGWRHSPYPAYEIASSGKYPFLRNINKKVRITSHYLLTVL